jgi:cytochrome c1
MTWDNADWSRNATLPLGETRENIYRLSPEDFQETKDKGIIHALEYPVTVTGLLVPYEPLKNFFEAEERNPLRRLVTRIAKKQVGFNDIQGMYDWLGVNPYNDEDATGIYKIPYPNGVKPDYPMGVTMMKTSKGTGMTFSCATCHSSKLFGKTVMGLTNKRVRANEFFHMAKKTVPKVPSRLFKVATRATEDERLQFKRTKYNLNSVGVVVPQVVGLDTSLPQVALSLARRNLDEYATKNKFLEKFPRKNPLTHFVADSKPAVWWNLKYKTRWLSDGSIVAGNPILTNFLWNEIGRGTDLKELEKWMQENTETIKELTVAAFSTKAPRWTDFFDVSTIDLEMAKRGEKVFKKRCAECHGRYEKAWNLDNADELSPIELLETTVVKYHKKTPVKDVGTDPGRYEGIKHFAKRLNDLKISKWMKTTVEPQKGYVPPPLVGIWARYPYLHNNSIPNLCAFLTRDDLRPKKFVQGPADNIETDFDSECVGYPVGDDIPKDWWKDKDAIFDTTKPGLRNVGHIKAFISKDGRELLSPVQKKELIMFLKTL